jgi:hypothetical protein
MDIGTFSKGDSKGKGKGKDNGKGKGKSYQASCGHPRRDQQAVVRLPEESSFRETPADVGSGDTRKWTAMPKEMCTEMFSWRSRRSPEKEKEAVSKEMGGKGKQKGGVHEFVEEPESGEYIRHPPGLQGQEGDIGMFFTSTEDDPASTSSQGKSDEEKKTAVYVPPRRREKAEGLAITRSQRRILTNELTVGKAIEERRMKDLIKASVTEVSKQALTAKLETIQEEKEVLKQHKKEKEEEGREYSLRCHHDVKAGVGVKMAKRKEAS